MQVRLHQVDGKWPNLALLKASAWHKAQGHDVDWWRPLVDQDVDLLYVSQIFSRPAYLPPFPEGAKVLIGGTGLDVAARLPAEIEAMCPDYTMAPNWDSALGFTSRGCVRHCPFCVVHDKEGAWHVVSEDITDFWTGQPSITLLDNNLTADEDHFLNIVGQCIDARVRVNFSQGLDVRLITPTMARALAMSRQPGTPGRIHFAFDSVALEPFVLKNVPMMISQGIMPYRLMFFVLIGFNTTPEEDLHRVAVLDSLGVDAFVMPFDRSDPYQVDFARWCNDYAIHHTVTFDQYRRATRKAPPQIDGQEAMAL